MSMTANIPDPVSFFLAVCDVCLAFAFVGCIFTLVESAFVLAFPGKVREESTVQPPATILKPLHGAEPDLPARLATFCRQDYAGPIQVVCGTPDQTSPAIAGLRGMQAQLPNKMIELAVDPQVHGLNRKVSNLINMLPHARYDTLVLADSDIVVGRGYLRAVTGPLASARVGAVTCLYYGIGNDGLWSRLAALAINSHFLPQAITASSLRLAEPCCGATIALRRSMLDRIGGFGAFTDVLADDYAIGVAVRSAGYEVVTAPVVVGHCCFEQNLHALMRHQIRVARTIRSIDPIGYAGTIFTHPWPLGLIGMLSGSIAAALVAVAVLAARVLLCRCVERRFGLPRQNYWLIPLQDVIAFLVYVASFFGATVHWQGSAYRVAADGTLIEDKT
jgi:ceramide glucosyltransferase